MSERHGRGRRLKIYSGGSEMKFISMDTFLWLTKRRGLSADGDPSTASGRRMTAKSLVIIALFAAILISCSSVRQEDARSVSQEYKVGETVYVCGCPMMCCNSISRDPNGRCICNVPLRKGIVSKIHGHRIVVTVPGRGSKSIIANR